MTPTTTGAIPQWTLQDKIRKAREYAGLSQQELADRLSVTRTSVVNWERGHTIPLRPLLELIAERTGVDPDWLAGGLRKGRRGARGGYADLAEELPRVDSNHQPAGWWTDSRTPPATRELAELGPLRKRIRYGPIGQTAHPGRTAG